MTPFHIVVAEDNPADIYLIREALHKHNISCELYVVEDGQSAIELFADVGRRSARPDLILLDLNLPQHDGIEILRVIRSRTELAEVPVAILTSSDSPRDRHAVDDLRVTRYIRKPSELEAFLQIGSEIKEMLTGAASARAADP
jgi:CheY-like chemotaxis protein